MSAHLVVGLSGVGKSAVLKRLADLHRDFEIISFSGFALQYIANKTKTACTRESLGDIFASNDSLRNECIVHLELYIARRSVDCKVVVDSGGALVDLTAGSLISAYSLFQNIDLSSVCVLLADASKIRERSLADKVSHIYSKLNDAEIMRKHEDIRLYGHMMAIRKNCSLILAWNDEIEDCTETIYEGIIRAEKALALSTAMRK